MSSRECRELQQSCACGGEDQAGVGVGWCGKGERGKGRRAGSTALPAAVLAPEYRQAFSMTGSSSSSSSSNKHWIHSSSSSLAGMDTLTNVNAQQPGRKNSQRGCSVAAAHLVCHLRPAARAAVCHSLVERLKLHARQLLHRLAHALGISLRSMQRQVVSKTKRRQLLHHGIYAVGLSLCTLGFRV